MFNRLVTLATLVHATAGIAIEDVDSLMNGKLANYNANLRPVRNQSQPVYVFVGLELISVKEFDEVNEKITIIAAVDMFWIDQIFAWNASDYGGVEMITINESKVWKPTLILVNTFDKLEEVGGSGFIIRIKNTGDVSWHPGSVLSAACQVDITYYPWDTQVCNFTFSAWGFAPSEVQILLLTDKVWTNFYSPSGIWDFIGSRAFLEQEATMVRFEVRLKRKPHFITINVILPIVFMSCLNLVVFLIPTDSGERVSYCITVLLSIAVFLTIVGDNLPKTSNPMSILSYYLISVLGLSVGITLATIFSLRIYSRQEQDRVSNFWRQFLRVCGCKWFKIIRHKRTSYKIHANDIRPTVHPGISIESQTPNRAGVSASSICTESPEQKRHAEADDKLCSSCSTQPVRALVTSRYDGIINCKRASADDVTWKAVSVAIDNVCLVSFALLTLTGSLWSFITIISNA